MEITADIFEKSTGNLPVEDDLERCNCPLAGTFGHQCCGWNKEKKLPQFMVGPILDTTTEVKT